jgi:hypothetical protein
MTTPGSHGPGQQPSSGVGGWGPPSVGQQPGSFPPPPPGAVPQGQYPPPDGAFAQGQGWAPQQQSKGGGAGTWIGIIGGIVAVLLVVVAVLAFIGGDPEVGDCLQEDGQDLSVVDCDDADAAWRLVGVQEGEQTYDEYLADPQTCADFLPEAIQSFWIGENGDQSGQGQVYCVAGA